MKRVYYPIIGLLALPSVLVGESSRFAARDRRTFGLHSGEATRSTSPRSGADRF